MTDVVEGGELSEIRRLNVELKLLVDLNTPVIRETVHAVVDKNDQEFLHLRCLGVLKTVVRWVLHHSTEEVRPCDPIHALLLRLDCAAGDLCVDVVVDLTNQRGLNREGIVEILSIEVLLALLHEHAGYAFIVELWTTRATNHLENVRHRHVHITLCLRVKELRAFNDHQPSR